MVSEEAGYAKTMVAGALAGSLARIPTHPLDTMKSRMMASRGASSGSLLGLLGSTARQEGVRGLYRGFWFTVIASFPASCIYFTSQEWSRDKLFSNALLSGFFAETLSCMVWVPIDVVKERLQAQEWDEQTKYGDKYRNARTAVRQILREEGLLGFYKGYMSTLASFGPFSALYFFFYEHFREWAQERAGQAPIPGYMYWLGGGASGAAAAFLTSPLDLVKLRKQIDPSSSAAFHQESLLSGLNKLVREEGTIGSFRGASARVLFLAPTTAFSMALFELIKQVL